MEPHLQSALANIHKDRMSFNNMMQGSLLTIREGPNSERSNSLGGSMANGSDSGASTRSGKSGKRSTPGNRSSVDDNALLQRNRSIDATMMMHQKNV